MTAGNVSMPVTALELDPALQARVAVDHDVVDDYAEAMKGGATFPPLEVLEVDGRHLVVDGWHRLLAAQRQKIEAVTCQVRRGTWREALAAAAAANLQHGLRRTRADKRKAVRMLLQDGEWCALSSRELGARAGVSHAFVNKVRREYDLRAGEVLTDERLEEVDGELPPRWQALVGQMYEGDVRAMRAAPDHAHLAKAMDPLGWNYRESAKQGVQYRLAELADVDRDVDADTAATLDNVVDLEEAIRSVGCDDVLRRELWEVWCLAHRLERMSRWDLQQHRARVKGRPALEAALEGRIATLAAPSAWDLARELADRGDETIDQLEEHPDKVLTQLVERDVSPAVRTALRAVLEERQVEIVECPDPRCPEGWSAGGCCWSCQTWPQGARGIVERLRTGAAELLLAGDVLEVGRVRVGQLAIEALASLGYSAAQDWEGLEAWLQVCPDPELKQRLYHLAGGEQLYIPIPPTAGDGARA